jgi:hypothetical protein
MGRTARSPPQEGVIIGSFSDRARVIFPATIDWRSLETLVRHDPGARGLAAVRDAAGLFFGQGELQRAAEEIAGSPTQAVCIATGFAVRVGDRVTAETDGPAGALFLARMLEAAGIATTLVADRYVTPLLEAGLRFAGLSPKRLVNLASERNDAAARDVVAAWRDANLRSSAECSHVIFIERVGPSRGPDRNCRNMRGESLYDVTAPLDELIFPQDDARKTTGPRTIGIVDGGNEIGCGRYSDAALAEVLGPLAHIGCRTPTDLLIPAGVSNWGAYALGAAVAVLRSAQHPAAREALEDWTAEKHRGLLQTLVTADAVDGVTKRAEPTVDGIPTADYLAHFERIKTAVVDADPH